MSIYVYIYTHKTKCMYKCIQPIYTYIYIQNIYTQKHKTNLNAHPYLNIPIVKKHKKIMSRSIAICSVRKKLIHLQIQAV